MTFHAVLLLLVLTLVSPVSAYVSCPFNTPFSSITWTATSVAGADYHGTSGWKYFLGTGVSSVNEEMYSRPVF